jgi:hypothetical protein
LATFAGAAFLTTFLAATFFFAAGAGFLETAFFTDFAAGLAFPLGEAFLGVFFFAAMAQLLTE